MTLNPVSVISKLGQRSTSLLDYDIKPSECHQHTWAEKKTQTGIMCYSIMPTTEVTVWQGRVRQLIDTNISCMYKSHSQMTPVISQKVTGPQQGLIPILPPSPLKHREREERAREIGGGGSERGRERERGGGGGRNQNVFDKRPCKTKKAPDIS